MRKLRTRQTFRKRIWSRWWYESSHADDEPSLRNGEMPPSGYRYSYHEPSRDAMVAAIASVLDSDG